MRLTPHSARFYLLMAALLLALPGIGRLYKGHTGELLVAAPRISTGPFQDTVVYIVRHDFFRAYGYVVNKPVSPPDASLSSAAKLDMPVFFGGPVASDSSVSVAGEDRDGNFMIFLNADDGSGDPPANDVSARPYDADSLLNRRALIGYAGWGPFQLNLEIMHGMWGVIPYDPALVFGTPPEKMWGEARKRFLNRAGIKDEKVL